MPPFPFFSAAALAAAAQTNSPVRRRARWRWLDCIQQALAHNFDVQVQRYNPQIALYNLRGDYGGYDPLFNISGQHTWGTERGASQMERRFR